MVKYYQVDSEETGKKASELIYRIMSQEITDVKYLFAYGTDFNGLSYIEIPVNMVCPVFINENFNSVLSELSVLLSIEEHEVNRIVEKLKNDSVILGDIIPSSLIECYPMLKRPEVPPFETA